MRERDIEMKLIRAVRRSGGLALKFMSPGFNGVPDRLLLFMGGRAAFCEVKAPGRYNINRDKVTILDATAIQRWLVNLPCPDGIGVTILPEKQDSSGA